MRTPPSPAVALQPIDSSDRAILAQAYDGPVLVGPYADGVTYVCGRCPDVVLAEGIAEDHVWDLAVRCRRCGLLSRFPSPPDGMALPPGRVVIPGADEIPIETALRMNEHAVLTGDAAAKEPVLPQTRVEVTRVGDAAHLRDLIARVRSAMGPVFEKRYQSHQRGRKSRTPSARPHPLMVIVESLEGSIESFEKDTPSLDVRCATELSILLDILDEWQALPGRKQMLKALDNEYSHTVVALGGAYYLQRHGNSVADIRTKGRGPDFFLVTGPRKRVAVEVKAPDELRWPASTLTREGARRAVESAMDSAGTKEGGQLSGATPGVLLIGGFHLSPDDMQMLVSAGENYFDDRATGRDKAHVMAVVIVSIGATITLPPEGGDDQGIELGGQIVVRVAKNRAYEGEIELKQP